jgi:3-dehydroquinate synthase
MLAAARISEWLGMADESLTDRHMEIIERLGQPTTIPTRLRPDEILTLIRQDKLAEAEGPHLVLLRRFGQMIDGFTAGVEDYVLRRALLEGYG